MREGSSGGGRDCELVEICGGVLRQSNLTVASLKNDGADALRAAVKGRARDAKLVKFAEENKTMKTFANPLANLNGQRVPEEVFQPRYRQSEYYCTSDPRKIKAIDVCFVSVCGLAYAFAVEPIASGRVEDIKQKCLNTYSTDPSQQEMIVLCEPLVDLSNRWMTVDLQSGWNFICSIWAIFFIAAFSFKWDRLRPPKKVFALIFLLFVLISISLHHVLSFVDKKSFEHIRE